MVGSLYWWVYGGWGLRAILAEQYVNVKPEANNKTWLFSVKLHHKTSSFGLYFVKRSMCQNSRLLYVQFW